MPYCDCQAVATKLEVPVTLRAVDVFTPNAFPEHTFVERKESELKRLLEDALATPNTVVSLSGPSKSGKTVLVEKFVGADNLILVSGAELRTAVELWDRVLGWIGIPLSTTSEQTQVSTHQGGVTVSAKSGLPVLAELGGQTAYTVSSASTNSEGSSFSRGGLTQVEREIGRSDFVVFIDDYHYMGRELQVEVAKQIRAAAGRGIKICVASVPHRSDDVVRSNPELRGRTAHIDTKFWTVDELEQIAVLGFSALNLAMGVAHIRQLAKEACGSPQLMQQLCLQTCFRLQKRERQSDVQQLVLNKDVVREVLEQTSAQTDYSSLVVKLHAGPKTRGTERRIHQFKDGSSGDVYRAVLLAMASGEPEMVLSYSRLTEKVEAICSDSIPAGASITSACSQLEAFARAMYPDQRIVEWDEGAGNETLNIVDPYLLFYLRASNRLEELGRARA